MSTVEEDVPDPPPAIGSVLEGRYRLVGELGAGGIGWVFRAEHAKLGHHVAIKMLQARFVAHDQLRSRFEREAKALAALSHPHIVTLTDYSIVDGHPYLVMELLEGRTLGDLIREGPVPEPRARRIVRQVLEALAYAHQRGFVHRDLKPENVFLVALPNEPDYVKVLDFGFVKLFDPELGHPIGSELTRSGVGFGTPSYMSPEQASGDRTGPPTDVYALGITIFEMLAGHRPFVGEIAEVVRQQMTAPLPPLLQGDLEPGPELAGLLERATAKAASERFPSAVEMLDAWNRLPDPSMREAGAAERTARSRNPGARSVAGASELVARRILAGALVLGLAAFLVVLVRSIEVDAPAFVPAPGAAGAATSTAPLAVGEPDRAPSNASRAPAEPSAGPRAAVSPRGTDAPSAAGPATAPAATADVPVPSDESPSGVSDGAETEPTQDDGLGPSPWQSRPRVATLSIANRQIAEGRILTGSTESAIDRYGHAHRDDPRPYLLLAANAFRQGQESVALARYELAQRTAPDARGDPRMLRHLVRLSAEGRVTNRAARSLERIYGALAAPAVARELARADLDPRAAARLRQLAARLH